MCLVMQELWLLVSVMTASVVGDHVVGDHIIVYSLLVIHTGKCICRFGGITGSGRYWC